MNALRPAFSQGDAAAKPSRSTTNQAQTEMDLLTNQTIVGMVRSKVASGVIINAIKASPGRYSLDPKSLIQLSGAGVPAAVIEAMQEEAGAESRTVGASQSQPRVQATSSWVGSTSTDRLEGTKTVEAHRVFSVDSGAFVGVTADCQQNRLPGLFGDQFFLQLIFEYVPAHGSKVGFSTSGTPTTFQVNQNAFTNNATITQQGGASYVRMRVSADGSGSNNVMASSSGTSNTASFMFGVFSGTNISMEHALQSNKIQVGIALDDGNAAFVEIEPQEASFQEFASTCRTTFPKPAPAVAAVPAPKTSQETEQEGAAYMAKHDYDHAIASFEAALVLDKNNALARRLLPVARRLKESSTGTPPR